MKQHLIFSVFFLFFSVYVIGSDKEIIDSWWSKVFELLSSRSWSSDHPPGKWLNNAQIKGKSWIEQIRKDTLSTIGKEWGWKQAEWV